MIIHNWTEVERIFAGTTLQDFRELRWVQASYDRDQNSTTPWTQHIMTLLMRLAAPSGQSKRTIDVLLTNVQDLRLGIGSSRIPDIIIREVKSIIEYQLEGLRYEVNSGKDAIFQCKCKNVEIVEIGIESPDGEYQREWIQSCNE